MHLVSHLHQASAAVASAVLDDFLLPEHPRVLAVVQHTRIVLLSLPAATPPPSPQTSSSEAESSGLLSEVGRIELNARILAIRAVSSGPTSSASSSDARGKTRLVILTDHHLPRLVVVRYDAEQGRQTGQPFITESTLPLEEITRPCAELGLGLTLEDIWPGSSSHAAPEYLLSHTHSGMMQVVPIVPLQEEEGSGDGDVSIKGKGKAKAGTAARRASRGAAKGRLSMSGVAGSLAQAVVQTGTAFGVR